MIKTTKITKDIHAVSARITRKKCPKHGVPCGKWIRGIAYVPTQENAWRVNRMLREQRILEEMR